MRRQKPDEGEEEDALRNMLENEEIDITWCILGDLKAAVSLQKPCRSGEPRRN